MRPAACVLRKALLVFTFCRKTRIFTVISRCSSGVERQFCKLRAGGSNPSTGLSGFDKSRGGRVVNGTGL